YLGVNATVSCDTNFYNDYFLYQDERILIPVIGHELGHAYRHFGWKKFISPNLQTSGKGISEDLNNFFNFTQDISNNINSNSRFFGLFESSNLWESREEESFCDEMGVEFGSRISGYPQMVKGINTFFERLIADGHIGGSNNDPHPANSDRINRLLSIYPISNHLPDININAPANIDVNKLGQIIITASDEDGDIITYYPTYSGPTGGISFYLDVASTGKRFNWTDVNNINFQATLPGLYNIIIVAKDGSGQSVSRNVVINVTASTPDPNTGNWTVTVD
ncbi:MAG: M48 family metalloprotease, partial [Candidatus Eremiobacterota bacterium]